MDQDFRASYVVGVSAAPVMRWAMYRNKGAGQGDCILAQNEEKDKLEEMKRAARTRSLFDMDQLFDRFPNGEIPFDYGDLDLFSSPTECELVLTNCRTGRAEYRQERQDRKRLMDLCRASCSVPVGTPMVEIGGTPYLDGGLADSIPILRAMEKGWRKNIVVLTRNAGYRKKPPHAARALYQAAYTKYPELLKTLLKRARMYNRTLAAIEKWEREGRIFVIRPQMKAIGRLESDPDFWKLSTGTAMSRYAGSMRRCRPIFKSKKQRGENLQS